MIRSTLDLIGQLFSDSRRSDIDLQELFNETVLLTLARATNADSNIHPKEVSLVIEKVKEVTGEEVSIADVHVAARSKLFEEGPLEDLLDSVAKVLPPEKKLEVAHALAEIMQADEMVTSREIRFFDIVCQELRLRPSDLIGLQEKKARH